MGDADRALPGNDLNVTEDNIVRGTRGLNAYLGAIALPAIAHIVAVEDVANRIGISGLRVKGVIAGNAKTVVDGGMIGGNDVVPVAVNPLEIVQHLHVLDRHILFILDIECPGSRILDGDAADGKPIGTIAAAVCAALDDSLTIVSKTVHSSTRRVRNHQYRGVGVNHTSARKSDVVDRAGNKKILRSLLGLATLQRPAGVPGIVAAVGRAVNKCARRQINGDVTRHLDVV